MRKNNKSNNNKKTSRKLTLKKEKFCQAYFTNTGNATQAYRDVYNCAGMSEKSITQNACRLLKDINITSTLEELKSELQKRFEYTAEISRKKLEKIQEMAMNQENANFNAYLKAEDLIQKITGLQKQVLVGTKNSTITVNTQIIHTFVRDMKEEKEKEGEREGEREGKRGEEEGEGEGEE
jgi:hypothetical protein